MAEININLVGQIADQVQTITDLKKTQMQWEEHQNTAPTHRENINYGIEIGNKLRISGDLQHYTDQMLTILLGELKRSIEKLRNDPKPPTYLVMTRNLWTVRAERY